MTASSPRVLLLHPNAAFLDTARDCLEDAGWECCLCGSTGAAVSATSFAPDVLLIGLPLPGLEGSAALAALRALPQLWATPALIIAAHVSEQEVARLRTAGATRVLTAPLKAPDLPLVLDEFLEEARRSSGDAWQMQLAALHRDFLEQLPKKVAQIESDWRAFLSAAAPEKPEFGRRAHRQAHSLVGGGATFGFPEISSGARRLEIALRPLRDTVGEPLDNTAQAAINAALDELKSLVQQSQGRISWVLGAGLPRLWRATQERSIWLAGLPSELAAPLASFGFSVRSLSVAAAFEAHNAVLPTAVVADLESWLDFATDGLAQKIPLLLVGPDNFENRLRAVRAKARGFCPVPLTAETIAASLDTIAPLRLPLPLRVLLACEDEALAELYTLVLAHSGILVRIVAQTKEVPHQAHAFAPDLFLIDGAQSDCDAVELGWVLRSMEAFHDTPIIFLENNWPEREIAELRAVGDEILSVPVVPALLVDTVAKRAAHYRALRELQTHDALTGLLTAAQWQEQLDIEISRARRQNSELVLAFLDVCGLQEINAQHGYAAGDHVLRALARLVVGRLRKTDVVGRQSGRLAVLLHGAPFHAAREVLDILSRDCAALRFTGIGSEFSFELRYGAAALSELSEPENISAALQSAAENALNAAKTNV